MNKTETPKLSEAVLGRLCDYAALFRDDFCRHDQARWAAIYLQGLLRDGERKSIEPLAGRVVLPAEWDIQDPTQALQNFVNQSPWRERTRPANHVLDRLITVEISPAHSEISYVRSRC